jgi:hypothetical protein
LSSANKNQGAQIRGNTNTEGMKGEESQDSTNELRTWKTRHAGPVWIRSASFSTRLSEVSWSRNSYHSSCSA